MPFASTERHAAADFAVLAHRPTETDSRSPSQPCSAVMEGLTADEPHDAHQRKAPDPALGAPRVGTSVNPRRVTRDRFLKHSGGNLA